MPVQVVPGRANLEGRRDCEVAEIEGDQMLERSSSTQRIVNIGSGHRTTQLENLNPFKDRRTRSNKPVPALPLWAAFCRSSISE